VLPVVSILVTATFKGGTKSLPSEIHVGRVVAGVSDASVEVLLPFGRSGRQLQSEGAVGVLDVAEDTAAADRGELLIITDQPHTGTSIDGELDGRVEGESVGHAGFVDDHQC
jgi:hypothetical protein